MEGCGGASAPSWAGQRLPPPAFETSPRSHLEETQPKTLTELRTSPDRSSQPPGGLKFAELEFGGPSSSSLPSPGGGGYGHTFDYSYYAHRRPVLNFYERGAQRRAGDRRGSSCTFRNLQTPSPRNRGTRHRQALGPRTAEGRRAAPGSSSLPARGPRSCPSARMAPRTSSPTARRPRPSGCACAGKSSGSCCPRSAWSAWAAWWPPSGDRKRVSWS